MAYTILKNICLSLVLISFTLCTITSCQNEIDYIPNAPRIELISVSSDTVTEFEEAFIITISYEDGNGDLGFEETDRFALFVRDIRLDAFDGFYLGPILPPNSTGPIVGQLNVEFPDLFVFGNSDSETTRFEIKMVDRSMNESNVLITEDIVIIKP